MKIHTIRPRTFGVRCAPVPALIAALLLFAAVPSASTFRGSYLSARLRTPEGIVVSNTFFAETPRILEVSAGMAGARVALGLGGLERSNGSYRGGWFGPVFIRTWGRPWGPEAPDEFYFGFASNWLSSLGDSGGRVYALDVGIYYGNDDTYVAGGIGLGLTL
jgi:hypothetical protein